MEQTMKKIANQANMIKEQQANQTQSYMQNNKAKANHAFVAIKQAVETNDLTI